MKWLATWSVLLVSGLAQEGPPVVAQPWFGQITGDRVRVRGGDGDFHAILTHLHSGDLVQVVGKKGAWLEVEVPGGLPAFVSLGTGGKKFIDEPRAGEGLVTVNDLMVRGNASTDYPPVGRLMAGARVVILDKKPGFARILAGKEVKGHIHESYVKRDPDQARAAPAFAAAATERRRRHLEEGVISRQLVARESARDAQRSRAREAFKKYESQNALPVQERSAESVREALSRVREEAPAGHPDRVRAETLLKSLDGWESTRRQLEGARARFDAVAREAAEAEKRYATDLEKLRQEMEEREKAGKKQREEAKGPYIASGILRRNVSVSGLVGKAPNHALYQGDKVVCLLESHRYDLSHYTNLRVGIVAADGPDVRPNVKNRIYTVKRLEVLSRR